ncbi:MAG: tRNA (adenosine(37)-N6)-dimethylallyltransferase MiaA [Wenzhouxiangellaceae bacterium]|nr:tRNA (adenosine(37)-N6)-dimethylallyltransferase MiaA [Wenzhouxiangellaceae bacterium]
MLAETARRRLPPCLVLTGPTAAGKTGIALELARRFDVHLISADSVQVYRGMNVGTAKPDAATLREFPHQLIDIRDPEQAYTAADFVRDAEREIARAQEMQRLPVIVGGTTMYLRALRYGLDPMPPADPATRDQISREADKRGWPAMHDQLAGLDPLAAGQIQPTDAQRIQRALEMIRLTGRPASSFHRGRGADRMSGSRMIVMAPAERARLHRAINQRWGQMLEQGLLAETEALLRRPGLAVESSALRAVGYRQAAEHLKGRLSLDALHKKGAAATRQLAKRQITALRQWGGAFWYDPLNRTAINRIIHSVGWFFNGNG